MHLTRRRALGNVGARIISRTREELRLGENLDAIYRELVYFNHATIEGETLHDRKPIETRTRQSAQTNAAQMVGHDENTEDKISKEHRGYMC